MKRTLLASLLTLTACFGADPRPNVVVLLIDDLGYADMSSHPDAPADVHTPAIDRLVARGVSFSNAYATAPICSPARVGLATGRYQQRWGNYWYGEGGLPNGIATIASTLRDLGYATKKVGKNHNNGGPAAHPLDHGFEEFLGFNHHTHDYLRLSEKDLAAYQRLSKQLGILEVGPLERDRGEAVSLENSYTTEVFTDEAIEFIERDHGGRPFYLHLSHNAVHMPTYVGHPDYLERFGVPQPVWDRDADHWEFPFWDPRQGNWRDWHEAWGHLGAVDPFGRRRYLLQLAVLDDNIGRLMTALESSGKLDHTIIVFLSDNGGELNTYSNNGRLAGAKYMFGEGGIRIPMVLAYPPQVAAGIRREDLVSTMDIFPTLLELVGDKAPADIDGRSLLPVLAGEKSFEDRSLVWAQDEESWVVRSGPWKLSNHIEWKAHDYVLDEENMAHPATDLVFPGGPLRLINLERDLQEKTDVSDTHPEVVAKLRAVYETWKAQMAPNLRRDHLWQTWPPSESERAAAAALPPVLNKKSRD
jgi:arylsulfatase B